MRAKSQYRIADIVVMRHLNAVKYHYIFQFRRISYDRAPAYDCAAANKRAVTNLCFFVDNERAVQTCGRRNLRRFCNPDMLAAFFKTAAVQTISKLDNKVGDFSQYLPWIVGSLKESGSNRFVQIV